MLRGDKLLLWLACVILGSIVGSVLYKAFNSREPKPSVYYTTTWADERWRIRNAFRQGYIRSMVANRRDCVFKDSLCLHNWKRDSIEFEKVFVLPFYENEK